MDAKQAAQEWIVPPVLAWLVAHVPVLAFLAGLASMGHHLMSPGKEGVNKAKLIGLLIYGVSIYILVDHLVFTWVGHRALAGTLAFGFALSGVEGYRLLMTGFKRRIEDVLNNDR